MDALYPSRFDTISPQDTRLDRPIDRPSSTPTRMAPHVDALYPLRFDPILKRILWGGRRLGSVLDKSIGSESDYAEAWELSDHRNDVSRVSDGPLAGQTLRDLIQDRPVEILGPDHAEAQQFPLLVKFLDAHHDLSLQVHPDDAKGKVLADDNGKTEVWVIIQADPGSLIYSGLRSGVTREQFAHAMETGDVEPLLHRFEPRPGDCVFIPAGTVHAIGGGIMLAEIQQMSDATFRVHDWNRVGADGKPRQLHKHEALESTDFDAGPVHPVQADVEPLPEGTREQLARCDYFALDRLKLHGPSTVGTPDRFTILIGLAGEGEIEYQSHRWTLATGQTILLPAAIGECRFIPKAECTLLTCIVP